MPFTFTPPSPLGGAAVFHPEREATYYRWQSPGLLYEKEKQNKTEQTFPLI